MNMKMIVIIHIEKVGVIGSRTSIPWDRNLSTPRNAARHWGGPNWDKSLYPSRRTRIFNSLPSTLRKKKRQRGGRKRKKVRDQRWRDASLVFGSSVPITPFYSRECVSHNIFILSTRSIATRHRVTQNRSAVRRLYSIWRWELMSTIDDLSTLQGDEHGNWKEWYI
jgi:hypothetical protein